MKLVIEIEMKCYSDARPLLKNGVLGSETPSPGDGASLRDINGNTVGRWMVVDEQAQSKMVDELLWDSLKRDPEHGDRRQTGWGTKTREGLFASLLRIFREGE